MVLLAIGLLAGLFLAYANGANDNLKGVASLLGSRTLDYKRGLRLATVATMAGSLVALWIGHELIKNFSGKGLVPLEVAQQPAFICSVGLAAAATVLLATRLGFPISTTHALTGALIGAGLVAVGAGVNFAKLGSKFALPLLLSPLLSVVGAALLYPIFRFLRRRFSVDEESGIFLVEEKRFVPAPASVLEGHMMSGYFEIGDLLASKINSIEVGQRACITRRYRGEVLGFDAQQALNAVHYISAASVCFARGLNDTPKIAAIVLAATAISPELGLLIVGVGIVVGGLVSGKRVAKTMSDDITSMNAGQGFTANLTTAFLVIGASRMGVPVSTTHVSCGALFGIGAVNGEAKWSTIRNILLAWVITLPVAGIIAAGLYLVF